MNSDTRLRLVRGVVYSFFLLSALGILGACTQPFDWSLNLPDDWGAETDKPSPILLVASQFTLEWDPPGEAVASFDVYARERGESEWSLVFTNLVHPEATITTADLAFGTYEFAVSSVSALGAESELHTSLDETADPVSGWYIEWTGE